MNTKKLKALMGILVVQIVVISTILVIVNRKEEKKEVFETKKTEWKEKGYAGKYLESYEEVKPDDFNDLLLAARFAQEMGDHKKATKYWMQILEYELNNQLYEEALEALGPTLFYNSRMSWTNGKGDEWTDKVLSIIKKTPVNYEEVRGPYCNAYFVAKLSGQEYILNERGVYLVPRGYDEVLNVYLEAFEVRKGDEVFFVDKSGIPIPEEDVVKTEDNTPDYRYSDGSKFAPRYGIKQPDGFQLEPRYKELCSMNAGGVTFGKELEQWYRIERVVRPWE